jgi:hypothetical protein
MVAAGGSDLEGALGYRVPANVGEVQFNALGRGPLTLAGLDRRRQWVAALQMRHDV